MDFLGVEALPWSHHVPLCCVFPTRWVLGADGTLKRCCCEVTDFLWLSCCLPDFSDSNSENLYQQQPVFISHVFLLVIRCAAHCHVSPVFLCLPLVCAVSVLHILCLWWLKLSSQWKSTHWVQGVVTSCFCLVFDFPTVVAEHGSGTELGGVTVS